jgi:LuxR family maltose regulon positive regulatory protein
LENKVSTLLLKTKLFVPPPRPKLVERPRLIERLNAALVLDNKYGGLHRKLTLISAPAGFGKTTLVSEWVQAMGEATPPIAIEWLSLDESDNDPTRFLAYFIAALQTIKANIGQGTLSALQSPQPPPTETILTALINEIAAIPCQTPGWRNGVPRIRLESPGRHYYPSAKQRPNGLASLRMCLSAGTAHLVLLA